MRGRKNNTLAGTVLHTSKLYLRRMNNQRSEVVWRGGILASFYSQYEGVCEYMREWQHCGGSVCVCVWCVVALVQSALGARLANTAAPPPPPPPSYLLTHSLTHAHTRLSLLPLFPSPSPLSASVPRLHPHAPNGRRKAAEKEEERRKRKGKERQRDRYTEFPFRLIIT